MRVVPFVISSVMATGLVFALNNKWGPVPPLGKFLSPQQGFWQNAEAADNNFSGHLKIPGMKSRAEVYFDERLVPHVFAGNDEDLYFVQGYLHARFRLWQMEFQTMAASGRISEILGNDERFIKYDRETRRMGMGYAAENALKMLEADPHTKRTSDAYTAGVNAYINSLTAATLPLEYKLLDYRPELWSNLKITLFLKQMSRTLASSENDLALTHESSVIPYEDFKWLYPQVPDSLVPIIPKGTIFDTAGITPVMPATADSLYFGRNKPLAVSETGKPDPNNGSNNWAVHGSKTQSGAPILCNDPHLELSLPSIWYEMQLTSPEVNVYGVSFPGSPGVIIGFNDSIAFGFTNAQRDVRDYYEIKFRDENRQEYWFNGQWKKVEFLREEKIKIRGAKAIMDTVAYTVFGPVIYDNSFSNPLSGNRAIACRWVAHDPSNEGLMWFYLNRARNYEDYYQAIKNFSCPGQNMLFASKTGDIALWQQAKFPARWQGQGLMLMPGEDSSYMWQGFIPQNENPHIKNPASGFIVSANQRPVDSTYPYFIPGNYLTPRGIILNKKLSGMQQITPAEMKNLQQDVFNLLAANARPALLKYVKENELNENEKKYLNIFNEWDLQASPGSKGQTVFACWWDSLSAAVWNDELEQIDPPGVKPSDQTLMEILLRDSACKYVDDIRTPEKESWDDVVTSALKKAVTALLDAEKNKKLEWARFKDPVLYHLLRNSTLPFARTALPVGGDGDVINAITKSHGPSWRMIVHLTASTEAYAVYPGGQSGNPGSKYYDNFVDAWTKGEYYTLWLMKEQEKTDPKIKWKLSFSNN